MLDWGTGQYELTAADLAPAAAHTIRTARIGAGDRVLDVGTGTGNAAILAAQTGATVAAVDPAPRLLQAAAQRAEAEGVQVALTEAHAADLPYEDGSFDVVVSVFAVIYAPDAPAAAAELLRVTRPGGRIVLTSWIAGGPVDDALTSLRRSAQAAAGTPGDAQPGFAWDDPAAVTALFTERGGEALPPERGAVHFKRPTARDYLDEMATHHPLVLTVRATMDPERWENAMSEALVHLESGNRDALAFSGRSRYAVTTIRRPD